MYRIIMNAERVKSVGCAVRDLVALLMCACIPQEFVHLPALTLTGDARQATLRDRPQAGRLLGFTSCPGSESLGDPYDGVQLSYDAGRRNLYLTPEGALRLAFLLAAAVERDIDIR